MGIISISYSNPFGPPLLTFPIDSPRPPSVYCIDADSPAAGAEVTENFDVRTAAASDSAGPRLKRKLSKFVRRTFSHDDDDDDDEKKTGQNGTAFKRLTLTKAGGVHQAKNVKQKKWQKLSQISATWGGFGGNFGMEQGKSESAPPGGVLI